jgi:hypothetical protein
MVTHFEDSFDDPVISSAPADVSCQAFAHGVVSQVVVSGERGFCGDYETGCAKPALNGAVTCERIGKILLEQRRYGRHAGVSTDYSWDETGVLRDTVDHHHARTTFALFASSLSSGVSRIAHRAKQTRVR